MNLDDVRSKLEVPESNQRQLERLRAMGADGLARDPAYLDSALHRLQTSIQALLDVAAYVLAALDRPAPRTSADIVSELADLGLVAAQDVGDYRRMVAFRNRLVHPYNRVDPGLVWTILDQRLDDLTRLRQALVDAIVANPDRPR